MAEKVARTLAVAEIAPDVLEIEAAFVTPPALTWRAGQFISIRCGDPAGDPDARRSYSISSSPARQGGLELLVKLLPGGAGSEFFKRLAPGSEIPFTGPMGFFTNELNHAGDAVFAATGTGIAAALPMIAETLARPAETGKVRLYWGMRDEGELYWTARLDALASSSPRFQPTICLSRPSAAWTGTRGRINGHVIEALPALERPVFYLVGNGDMVKELKGLLVGAGIDRKRQIRTEIFYPETKAA